MKVTIDVDCTPEEARKLLGLPDLEPMQKVVMEHVQEQVMGSIRSLDPETVLKAWMPLGIQGLENFQRMMFGAASAAAGGSGSSRSDKGGDTKGDKRER